ncbi:unnamed protein product, partial [Mesorhabditis spiculigera]
MNLQELIQRLREIFDHDEVNTDEVMQLLQNYKSNSGDWSKFANWDPNKYTRNLVDRGNGKYNLMVLCWPSGVGSQIHDHTDAHCFVKMLDGTLQETKFAWPTQEGENMIETSRTCYDRDGVSYMSDELGLHRMENPSHVDGAVSLHLYSPPYQTCNAFDQRTGQKTKCTVTFYTKYGQKVDYRGSKQGRTPTEAIPMNISCENTAIAGSPMPNSLR